MFGLYASGASGTQRHHVESAVVAFVVVGFLLLLTGQPVGTTERPPQSSGTRWEWVFWCGSAVLLYWPSLSVGLLSDDFVLADRAQRGEFGVVSPEFFRPLPLLAWSAVLSVAGPAGLHLLNIVGHGFVAFLASRVAEPFLRSRYRAWAAGLVVLAFPASVEAVAWSSGVFDVAATLFVLAAVLVSRQYSTAPHGRVRVAMISCAALALLSKETAAVLPAIVALDAWARRHWPRALRVDLAGLSIAVVGFSGLRVFLASEVVHQPLSRYVLQRWAFGTLGGLSVPWHVEFNARWPWIPIASVIAVLALATAFFVGRVGSDRVRAAVAVSAWVLLGTLPTLPFFFVAADLQGSRYLYLPAVGYAILLSIMAAADGTLSRRCGVATLVVVILSGLLGTRLHQEFWRDAATTRDLVLESARHDRRLQTCRTVAIGRLPDVVEGAYVFRNGADLAFGRVGLTLSANPPDGCRFDWDQKRQTLLDGESSPPARP